MIIVGITPGTLSTITNIIYLAISLLVGTTLKYTLLWRAERQRSPILADIVDTASLSLSASILSVPGSLLELRKNSKITSTVIVLLCSSFILIAKTILPKFYADVEVPFFSQGNSNIMTNFKICASIINWLNDTNCYTTVQSVGFEMDGRPSRPDIFYSMLNTGVYNNLRMVQDTTTEAYAIIGISDSIGSIAFQALGLVATAHCYNVSSSTKYQEVPQTSDEITINGSSYNSSIFLRSVPSLQFVDYLPAAVVQQDPDTRATDYSFNAVYYITYADGTTLDGKLLTGSSKFRLTECAFNLTVANVHVDRNTVRIVPTSADAINMTVYGVLALTEIGAFEMSGSFLSEVFYAPNFTTTMKSLENQLSRQYLGWAAALGLYGDETLLPVQFYAPIKSTIIEDNGLFIAATTLGITVISIVTILLIFIQRKLVLVSKAEPVGREQFTWWGIIRAYSNEVHNGDWATDNETDFRRNIRKARIVFLE